MGQQNIAYHNDQDTKQHENSNRVHYEACGKAQKYSKEDHSKEMEDNCHTKYVTGSRAQGASSHRSKSSHHSGHSHHGRSHHSEHSHHSKRSHHSKSANGLCSPGASRPAGDSVRKSSLELRMARCYDIKRGHRRNSCNRKYIWQHGKYVRDECGFGIVPKRYLFLSTRRVWCKTPLSMYQATIGEMARKLLCREISVPRDVKEGPPSNIAEYILPPCRGYYRKYDCMRPCEDDYAVMKAGKKVYRDRVERYWEPCLSKGQKQHLDVNDYAPHNVYLGTKIVRRNIMDEQPCW